MYFSVLVAARRACIQNRSWVSLLALMLLIAGCGREPQPARPTQQPPKQETANIKLRLTFQPMTLGLPYYLASEKGLLDEEKVEVEQTKAAGSGPMLDSLVADQADVAVGLACPNVFSAELAKPGMLKVVCLTVSSPEQGSSAILVHNDSNVKEIKDLQGKKLGVSPAGTTMKAYARVVLRACGVDPGSVTIEPLGAGAEKEALLSHRIDALLAIQPTVAILLDTKQCRSISDAPLNKYVCDPFPGVAIVLRREAFASNPVAEARFVRAIERAIDSIRQDEPAARQLLSKWTPLPAHLQGTLPLPSFLKASEIQAPVLQKLADVLLQEGELKSPVKAESLLR